MTQIREIMNGPVLSVDAMTPVVEAAQMMRDHNTGDVVVTNEGRLTGILTDRDVVIRLVAEGIDASTAVSEVCTSQPVTVDTQDTIEDAAQLMRDHAVRRLPVCENDGVVGFISLGDLSQVTASEETLQAVSSAAPDN